MFNRLVTIITVISISTLFPNGIAHAYALKPPAPLSAAKDKKPSCAPCAAGRNDPDSNSIDNLAILGRRTQPLPFLPIQSSIFDGTIINLVSTATGRLEFAVTDLEVKGAMPITFQRAYQSDNGKDIGLGVGWSFAFDDRISLDGKTAQLSTGAGAIIAFQRETQSQRFILKTDEPSTHQSFELAGENTIVEQSGLLTRTYKKQGSSYHLSQITDLNGNAINIGFDERGNITQIANSSGGAVTLEWSTGKEMRLLSATDTLKRQIIFKQDAHRLRAVKDSARAEWTYDYQGRGLTRAVDPLNRVLLRARYDREGHVIEASDSAGTSLYDYEFGSAGVSRHTVITDAGGAKTVFEHNAWGATTAISDDEGQTARIEYNAANRPARISSSSGDEATFSYDARNRVNRRRG